MKKLILLLVLIIGCSILQGCSPKLPEEAALALDERVGYVVSDDIASVVKAKSNLDFYGYLTVEAYCVTLNTPVPGLIFSDETYGYFTLARKGNDWDIFIDSELPSEWPKIGCSD